MQLYRGLQEGIDRGHSCGGTAQDFRIMQKIDRHGLSRRALSSQRSGQTWPRWMSILGTNQIEEIVRAVDGTPVPLPDSYGRSDADLYLYDHTTPRTLIGPRYTAYMKIAEGCDHTCAFCIIPKIRGPIRSRSIPSLVQEATQLAAQGVKEITLVSQDTTSYGLDLGIQEGLAGLLEALSKIEGLCLDPFPVCLSECRSADRLIEVDQLQRENLQIYRHALAARQRVRSEIHEAGREQGQPRTR